MEKTLNCEGGPYSGRSLTLQNPKSGTLTFSVKGMKGRYVHHIDQMGYPNGKREILKWESIQ